MLANIDWISFTSEFAGVGQGGHMLLHLPFWVGVAAARLGRVGDHLLNPDGWESASSRAPYTGSIVHTASCIRMFYSPASDHVLFELSGRSCELLRNADLDLGLIAENSARLTRLDIAFDILTEDRPAVFVATLPSGRVKTRASLTSATGDTEYLGSQKSDRFARVYRYNPPHPRSHLLRVEVVLRREQARVFAAAVATDGFENACLSVAALYPFDSPLWDFVNEDTAALAAWRPDRRSGGTVRWLMVQVLPAAQRLVDEGNLDDLLVFYQKLGDIVKDGQFRPSDANHE